MQRGVLAGLVLTASLGYAIERTAAQQSATQPAAQGTGQRGTRRDAQQGGGPTAPIAAPQGASDNPPQQGQRGSQSPAGMQADAPHGAEAPAGTPQRAGAPAAGGGGMRMGFDVRTVSPEVAARGKAIYSVNCSFCHGSDAGGGAVGPNLQRSDVVLQDRMGEMIAPIVHGARADKGMPRIDLTEAQIADVAGFLHSIPVSGTAGNRERLNIVVGNATEGKATFDRMCSSCHTSESIAYIPKGIADPRAMQQAWLLPSTGGGRGGFAPPPTGLNPSKATKPTVTVTVAGMAPVTGEVVRIDDFYVALTMPDGTVRSFERNGDKPKVEFKDPAAAHRELFRKYTDKEIHDITAYLVTLK